MRTITPALESILRDHFQAAGDGYAARFEVDTPSDPVVGPDRWYVLGGGNAASIAFDGVTMPDGTYIDNIWHGNPTASPSGLPNPANIPYYGVFYFRLGGQGFNFGTYAVSDAGAIGGDVDDSFGGNLGNIVMIGPVNGPGTMTIHTRPIAGHETDVFEVDRVDIAFYTSGLPSGNAYSVAETITTSAPVGVDYAVDVDLSLLASDYTTTSYRIKHANLNKNLRMGPDQAEIELANEDLPLGFGPTSIFPSNSRCRVYQWYGDPANAVLTFTGVIDKITDTRDPLTTGLTCRSLAGPILVDQTFSTTGPQGADEAGAIRTEANGVYLNREVDYIALDILERSGWPAGSIDVLDTSFVLDEFIREDGESAWDALARLAGFIGYTLWDDEDGVIHLRTLGSAAAADTTLTADYTYEIGGDGSAGSPHVMMLGWETDQYDLRTRVKVRGPLTTLKDAWTEVWRTSKIAYPVGVWHDPTDAANLRVVDRSTKRIYKLRQSDRAILSSVYIGGSSAHPLGLSGDPASSSVYWVLEAPWRTTGSTTGNKILKLRKSDNAVLARWAIPDGRWSAIKVSASYIWLTNLDTDKIYKRSKTTGAAIASYSIKYDGTNTFPQSGLGTTQTNPSGIMIDGTTLYYFFANSGTTARFLKASETAPRTLTGVVKTAGTQLHGGEIDTVTHVDCYGDSDSLHLVAKFTLKTPVTSDVAEEAIDTELEDQLGALAELEPRIHDSHPLAAAHPFLVRRETLSIDEVTSLAQAMQVAQVRLEQLNGRRAVLDVGIVGNPALQKTDLVRIIDPLTGITVDGRVDTLETDMSAGSPFVGTLALLPQAVLIGDAIADGGTSADAGGVDVNPTPDPSDPGPDD